MPESEYLVVGLGNPGPDYEFTPHNLGFLTIRRLAERNGIRMSRLECRAQVGSGKISGVPVTLAMPQTFMNLSGSSVKGVLDKEGLGTDRLIAVYDELDLPWGNIRVRPGGSAAGHNGVEDIIRCLGVKEFPRVRLGIHPGHPVADGAKFVLAPLKGGQRKELDALLDQAAGAVESILAEGVAQAMAKFNRRAPGPQKEEE
jgi:PTH1 family peptidyl-tRNA hydrolase